MSDLKTKTIERMQELGISPKRSLGQNFLINEATILKILTAVEKLKAEAVMEVGPGLGALTDRLRQKPNFQAIELDRTIAEYWRKQGVDVVEGDALEVKWHELLHRPTAIVGNLPYQISSRIVVDLSFASPFIKGMVFMFQKEVAERLVARPRTKEYGLLSVIGQVYWDISVVVNAGSSDFYPAPNVGSRVLRFDRRQRPASVEGNLKFLEVLKAAFAQRRKYLIKGVPKAEGPLIEMGLSRQVRAEELSPQEFVTLFERLK